MDLSYWSKLNPDIQFQDTVKLYFNRYLYRLAIRADGGRLINSGDASLELALITRESMEKMYNKSGWWGVRTNQLSKVNLKLLESVRLIKNKIPDIKIRVEEPSIQFYADNEDTLKKIAESLHNTDCITHINSPAANTEQLLFSNAILKKSSTDYDFKVILKDGKYSTDIKQQILINNEGVIFELNPDCR